MRNHALLLALCLLALASGCTRRARTETVTVVSSDTSGGTVVVAPAAPAAGGGFTMRQRQFIEHEDESFQSSVTYYQEQCHAPIDARIEWSTFLGEVDRNLDGQANYSFRLFCAYPLDHLAAQCARSEADRQAVVARVQAYTCVFGGPGARSIDLSAGRAQMAVDWDAPNYETFVSDYFGRNL